MPRKEGQKLKLLTLLEIFVREKVVKPELASALHHGDTLVPPHLQHSEN